MARIPPLMLLLAALATLASASAPTFCKCTCFRNSTIIPLGPQHGQPPAAPPPPPVESKTTTTAAAPAAAAATGPPTSRNNNRRHDPQVRPRAASSSCAQCNRAFCLQYNLPICKDAEEKDVVTSCFQRDSRKDQIIVWGFMAATAGLLGWAGAKRLLERGAAESGGRVGGGSSRSPGAGLAAAAAAAAGGGGGGGGGVSNGTGLGLFRRMVPSGSRSGSGSTRDAAGRGVYSPLENRDDGGAARGAG